jgi:RNA polymerase sigma-70 factor (ECF subfamily)
MRRKNVRERTASFDEELHYPCSTPSNPETSLLQRERAGILRRALAELPLELREVLVLRELEEFSYREIASIARVPMGTVMSRLNRARKRLQQVLLLPENVGEADSQNTPAPR